MKIRVVTVPPLGVRPDRHHFAWRSAWRSWSLWSLDFLPWGRNTSIQKSTKKPWKESWFWQKRNETTLGWNLQNTDSKSPRETTVAWGPRPSNLMIWYGGKLYKPAKRLNSNQTWKDHFVWFGLLVKKLTFWKIWMERSPLTHGMPRTWIRHTCEGQERNVWASVKLSFYCLFRLQPRIFHVSCRPRPLSIIVRLTFDRTSLSPIVRSHSFSIWTKCLAQQLTSSV